MNPAAKVALVTGASRGIGRATALRLAAAGHPVALNDVVYEGLQDVAEEISAAGGRAEIYLADVANEANVDAMFTAIEADLGGAQIVVNNAALTDIREPWVQIDTESWDRVLAVNLRGCFLVCQRAYPVMKTAQWGRLVNVSSVVARIGVTDLLHYSAAKAGVIGLTRSLAREVGADGITVNCVAPGAIRTEAEIAVAPDPQAAKARAFVIQALQRRGVPEDVADVIAFLASDAASFVTGQTINVDGGWVMS